MRKHRTTELPPAMYCEAKFGTKKDERDEIKEIAFTGFTLETSFDQNIALMKDGSVVFCHRFIKHQDADVDDEDDQSEPLIVGFKFNYVSGLYILLLYNTYQHIKRKIFKCKLNFG